MSGPAELHPIAASKASAEKHLASARGYHSRSRQGGELEDLALDAIIYAHRAISLFEDAQRLASIGKAHVMTLARAATMLESTEQTLMQAAVVFSNEE